jgi:outer membrane murein-binding lipoprotein Lpp
MTFRLARFTTVLALALALMALASPGAVAQNSDSAAALRRENDQLRERVSQLEARIKQLERDNEALKVEVSRLRAAGTPAQPGTPATPGAPGTVPVTTDVLPAEGQEPLASPDALLAALVADYTTHFADRTFDDNTRSLQIQEVRRWTRDAERAFKGNIEWVIRIDKENLPPSATEPIPFWIIDPASGKLLHARPVRSVLPVRIASRILESADTPVWDVRGQLAARPTVNAERAERGMLDFPPFIGPYAEFAYDLTVRTAVPREQK